MTKETFELMLKEHSITWNDLVDLTVWVPNRNSWLSIFKKAKTASFYGALGYHKGQPYVSLCISKEGTCQCTHLAFDFNDIVGISKRWKK